MKWYFPVVGTLILIFFPHFINNDSLVVFLEPVEGKTFLVPGDALLFDLTSSEPEKMFTLTEFYPDQSFIGQYDIQIEGRL